MLRDVEDQKSQLQRRLSFIERERAEVVERRRINLQALEGANLSDEERHAREEAEERYSTFLVAVDDIALAGTTLMEGPERLRQDLERIGQHLGDLTSDLRRGRAIRRQAVEFELLRLAGTEELIERDSSESPLSEDRPAASAAGEDNHSERGEAAPS